MITSDEEEHWHLYFIKSKEKKRHFLCFKSPQISILALKLSKKGQNKMFRQLIWGIVCLCRSNMTRDMIKNWKVEFSKNVNFHTFLLSNFCVKIFVSFHHLSRLQFSSYINNQHLIWKLWCLTFIWYPGEVAEAISLASVTSRSDRWQREKKSQAKIWDSSIFELERHVAPQKNSEIISNSFMKWNLKF